MPPDDLDERNLHDDYRRKQVRIRPPKPMRDVLSQLLAKRGYAALKSAQDREFQSFPLQAVGLGERAEPPVR